MEIEMFKTKPSMDAASYALWLELSAPARACAIRRLVLGGLCCLLWLGAWLLYGKSGLLALVLVWFGLFLPVGFAHINISRDVDDGFGYRFTFASGKSVVIVRDRYHAPDYAYYHMPYPRDSHCGGMVGPVSALVWYLDYGQKDD